jgi:hypothetical protein
MAYNHPSNSFPLLYSKVREDQGGDMCKYAFIMQMASKS